LFLQGLHFGSNTVKPPKPEKPISARAERKFLLEALFADHAVKRQNDRLKKIADDDEWEQG
jgi:hypothetical protein